MKTRVIETPIGLMMAVADEGQLYRLEFADHSLPSTDSNPVLDSIEGELRYYFAGALKAFKTPIALVGSPFQVRVWQALLTIPYGHTVSYADLAKSIGQPTASRAVGNANGKNPLAILVPCHRVIRHDGTLGGYSGGLHVKPQLIGHEKKFLP